MIQKQENTPCYVQFKYSDNTRLRARPKGRMRLLTRILTFYFFQSYATIQFIHLPIQ